MNDEWNEEKVPISIDMMKEMISQMRMAYDIYKEAKELATAAHEKYKEKESRVIAALEAGGLKNFNLPGLGTASLRRTYKVTCPRTIEEKRALFDYIREHHGDEFLDTFRSINSQSLNKWFNDETRAAEEEGIDLKVPGLADPTEHVSIQWRKG